MHTRMNTARTFPTHPLFQSPNGKGQTALFNIMKVYSLYDRELGYCQVCVCVCVCV